MDGQKLKILVRQKEGTKLDFKEKLNLKTEYEKKEFAKDIIAIANSIGGRGHLIIGIKDKTKDVIGIDPMEFSEETIQQVLSYRCDPPISVRVEYIEYEEKYIGVITIFRSFQRPHQMRQTGAFYIRRGSTTDFARRDELANMLQESGMIANELMPVYDVAVDVLNHHKIRSYCLKIGLSSDWENEKKVWQSLGIIFYDRESNGFCPTVGGMLLFCDNPQTYLPHCTINVIVIQDDKKREKTFRGSILTMVHDSYGYICENLMDKTYPQKVVLECIANAVLHRDYFDMKRNITILITDNKIEITNPGALPKGNNPHTLLKDPNPPRRNNWLYQKLVTLDDHMFLMTDLNLMEMGKAVKGRGGVKYLSIPKRNLFKVILSGSK